MSRDEKMGAPVDAWIEAKPEFARPICKALRAAIRSAAPELREVIKWGRPCYEGRGLVCSFAAFKHHVHLFFFKGARVPDPEGLLAQGENNPSGRSVRYFSLDEIPVKKLERLIRAAAKADADGTAKPSPRARRPELPMPKELAAALKRAPRAQAFFATLPPSCRREYIEWISTAKREETRTRRLEQTIAMLSESRRHNEEYRAKK